MRLKNKIYFLILIINIVASSLNCDIRFGSRNSAISLFNDSTLHLTYTLTVDNGTIKRKDTADIVEKDIAFYDSIFEPESSQVFVSGQFVPDTQGVIRLNGSDNNPQVFRADPGFRVDYLKISGNKNRLEGFPLFNNPIELLDENTTLTIAIKSVLNKNIELNGGMIILEDDLELADGVSLTGPGTVALNARRLKFGTEDIVVTSSLWWKGAADVYLSGKIDLSGSWTFEKECYFNADSTVLNLVNGGNLTVWHDSSLSIRQLKVSKLDKSKNQMIFFADDTNAPDTPGDLSTSELRIRRGALEITTTYTFDTGHVRVQVGSGQFISRDKIFEFSDRGHLTVEGVNAYYKTRTFQDNRNIRSYPDVPYNDVSGHITLVNNADIYHFRTFRSHNSSSSGYGAGQVGGNRFLGNDLIYEIDPAFTDVDGQGWYFHFARNIINLVTFASLTPIDTTFTNVVFKDFQPYHVEPLDGSSLTFKNNVTIELGDDISFVDSDSNTVTWTFQGDCKIDGKGKTIDFSQGGIEVEDFNGTDPSTLTLQDMTIDKFRDGAIEIKSNQSKIVFKDVKIFLGEDVSFSKGYFEIEGKVSFYPGEGNSSAKFIYDTDATTSSRIKAGSTLHFDRNVTFSYDPGTPHNSLIELDNVSSELYLKGATLHSSNVGLELTKGTLVVDHKCFVSNEATSPAEGISFGDGMSAANDLNMEIMPGGNIDVSGGILQYNNVNG